MNYASRVSAFLAVAAAIGIQPQANAADRLETVKFKSGTTSATLKSSLRGYDTVKYVLGGAKGQSMILTLSPSNASCYMNVTASGADTALFVGSTRGNVATIKLPSSGDYIAQVYLMRSAARRNETCRFSLAASITD